MRVILTFLIGLVLGGGGMIWFYVNGGEISVAGHELGPPAKTATAANPGAGTAAPKSPPQPRLVVRDITEGGPASSSPPPASPTPSATKPAPSASSPEPSTGKSDDNSFVVISNSFIVIKWPRW
jgi:hypothetical protein